MGINLGVSILEDFITDIWESIYVLIVEIFGYLFRVGQADLSAEWFLDTYELAFGLAIIVYGLLVALNIFQLGVGKLDGGQFTRNLTYRTVGFFYGVTLGPLFANQLGAASASLTKNLLLFGLSGAADDISGGQGTGSIVDQIGLRIKDAYDGGILGGQLARLVIGVVLTITLVVLAIVTALVGMMQYILGAFFPLVFVFIMSAKHRGMAKKFLGLMGALYLILPAAGLIIAVVIRAFGSFDTSVTTNPLENLTFLGSLAFGLVMAIGIPVATFLMLVRSGFSVAQAGHQMATAGTAGAGALGAGGASKVAMSNSAMSATPKVAAAAGVGVAATAATGGAAAPAAVGATGAAASGTAAAGAGMGGAATGASTASQAAAAKTAATSSRLQAGQHLSGTAEELARRPQNAGSQTSQNAFYAAQHLDENEAEAQDR